MSALNAGTEDESLRNYYREKTRNPESKRPIKTRLIQTSKS